MALVKCPECKGKVSNTILQCPHCGYCLSDEDKIVDDKLRKRNPKMLWIFIIIAAIIIVIVLFHALKPCEHQWVEATCELPAICKNCDATEGQALGHQWQKATCTEAKICCICDETEGEALGHQWQKATCTEAKVCNICGETEGKASGHKWKEATYTEPKTCTTCGKTQGKVLQKPETKVVGTYQMSYLDDLSTVTESLHFYSDGSVVHKCNDNDDDGYGHWSVNGTTISFSLFWEGSDYTHYETATIVEGGIMWGSSFLNKVN